MHLKMIQWLLVMSRLLKTSMGAKCLECYQCKSLLNGSFASCDDYYWHAISTKMKENLVVGCPEGSGFCVKKELHLNGMRMIQRGCIGKKDTKGNDLISGCIRIFDNKFNETANICFCDASKCNGSGRIFPGSWFSITSFMVSTKLLSTVALEN